MGRFFDCSSVLCCLSWDWVWVATRGETPGLKEEFTLFRSHFVSEIRSLGWVRLRKYLLGVNDPEYSASVSH